MRKSRGRLGFTVKGQIGQADWINAGGEQIKVRGVDQGREGDEGEGEGGFRWGMRR